MYSQTNTPTHNIQEGKPGLMNMVHCKCPRCRIGNMFQEKNPYKLSKMMKMNEVCPVCGQPFELEVGFFYGSGYISYGLGVAISVASLIAWWVFIGLSIHDNRIFYWLAFNAVLLVGLQPLLMRLSRSIWVWMFVKYDPDWPTNPAPKQLERINKEQANNW